MSAGNGHADRVVRCKACGEVGHSARGGLCSRVHRAITLMEQTGCSAHVAGAVIGVKHQAVSEAHKRRRIGSLVGGVMVDEHW